MSQELHQPTPLRPATPSSLLQESMDPYWFEESQTLSQILAPRCDAPTPSTGRPEISDLRASQCPEPPLSPSPHHIPEEVSAFLSTPKRNKYNKVRERLWFLTFPRNSRTKQEILDQLLLLPYSLQWALICSEAHADGAPHLHVACRFQECLQVRNLNKIFDPVGGKHCNYQVMKSIPGSLNYLRKTDKEPLVYGTLPSSKSKETKKQAPRKMDTIAQGLINGRSVMELAQEEPGLVMIHHQKMLSFQTLLQTHGAPRRSLTEALKIQITTPSGNSAEQQLHAWLQANVPNRKRPHKSPQLYLQAPTNHNKTSLVLLLAEYFKIYMMPLQEDFDSNYDDTVYDLIVLEEFSKNCCRSVQYINQFVEGSFCPLRVKGAQRTKFLNLPVMVLSNYEPSEFWKGGDISLFRSRFTHVILDQPLDLSLIKVEVVLPASQESS